MDGIACMHVYCRYGLGCKFFFRFLFGLAIFRRFLATITFFDGTTFFVLRSFARIRCIKMAIFMAGCTHAYAHIEILHFVLLLSADYIRVSNEKFYIGYGVARFNCIEFPVFRRNAAIKMALFYDDCHYSTSHTHNQSLWAHFNDSISLVNCKLSFWSSSL